MELFTTITLIFSGGLLTMVGISRMANPIKTFSNSSGIELPNDVNLLNEARGLGGMMTLAGIIALLGTYFDQIRLASIAAAFVVFIGFAIGRVVSISSDGKPNPKLIQGLIFELVLGGANAVALIMSV